MKIESKKLISRAEALQLLFSRWKPIADIETVPLDDALDRVVAQDIFSNVNLPVYVSHGQMKCRPFGRFHYGILIPAAAKRDSLYTHADTADEFDDAFDAVNQSGGYLF